jgi:hypothetical protein
MKKEILAHRIDQEKGLANESVARQARNSKMVKPK